MAQKPIWGTLASAPLAASTVPALHANSFSINFSQGITSYFGYGDIWNVNEGVLASWSGSISGFTTYGVTGNVLAVSYVTNRGGESWTFSWTTGCTIVG